MAEFHSSITSDIAEFIRNQKMFFVGTAPNEQGEVNISPKGYDTFRIIEGNKVIYLDYHGSGNETANHLEQNGKITLMWCSFEEEPLILRVFGRGTVILKGTDQFSSLLHEHFPKYEERIVRQIFSVEVVNVQTSCGWAVPFMKYIDDRPKLDDMAKQQIK